MKNKLLYISVGLIVIPYGLMVGGRLPYFLLYLYMLVWVLPLLHSFIGKVFLFGSIKIPPKELVAGEEISIKYEIVNPLGIGLPRVEVENSIAHRLTGKREETIVVPLKPKGRIYNETKIICRRRGIYEIGEIKIYLKDIFDLFIVKKTITTPMALKVYPRATPLRNLPRTTNIDPSSLLDLREYREGDSMKRIHWKASAKREFYMVKNYEEQGEEEVVIVLDSATRSYHNDQEGYVEDKAVEVAISIIRHFLQQNISTVLYYQEGEKTIEIKGNHFGYLKTFMENMVAFHPLGREHFSRHSENLFPEFKQGSTLFLITPLLDKEIGAMGIRLKSKNLQPKYIVLGDEEMDPFTWKENKRFAKALEAEGINTYIIDVKQDIRKVLEGKYANG